LLRTSGLKHGCPSIPTSPCRESLGLGGLLVSGYFLLHSLPCWPPPVLWQLRWKPLRALPVFFSELIWILVSKPASPCCVPVHQLWTVCTLGENWLYLPFMDSVYFGGPSHRVASDLVSFSLLSFTFLTWLDTYTFSMLKILSKRWV
jgi:hypothetical protein